MTDLFGQCPHVTAQKIFAGKWAILVFQKLVEKPRRFGELCRCIPNITQPALTKQLRLFESFNMITRRVYHQIPPKVEYSLTQLGAEALPVMKQMEVFGMRYIDQLKREDLPLIDDEEDISEA